MHKLLKLLKKDKSKKSCMMLPPFKNDLYKNIKINYDNFFTCKENQVIDDNKPLINQIKRISFELSNICNYSYIHKKCPISLETEKKILSSKLIYKVIDEMAEINYDGVFAFHRYNEPFIDPRLFDFIRYSRSKCPDSKVLILTNGFYFNQTIGDELAELGVWNIAVTAYSVKEYQRLISLDIKVPYLVFFGALDDRQCIYESEFLNLKSPCFAPVYDFTVNCNGDVALCCNDWKNSYTFGSLEDKTVKNILENENLVKAYHDLKSGNRNLDICKRCWDVR